MSSTTTAQGDSARQIQSGVPFLSGLCVLGGTYPLLIVAMLVALFVALFWTERSPKFGQAHLIAQSIGAQATLPVGVPLGSSLQTIAAVKVAESDDFVAPLHGWAAVRRTLSRVLDNEEVRYAIRLSLLSCTLTTILSLWVAVPLGYLMSRYNFRGKSLLDTLLDVPIVLPPLVIGLALLILFRAPFLQAFERVLPVTFAIPSIILAQFTVACAFAVRTMRVTFDQISPRTEQVALTLGCSRGQAFWMVALPEARHGVLAAGLLAWARSLGEFGPILMFSGATPMRTEVLPTRVFLEMNIADIKAAVAVSLIMVLAAGMVLLAARLLGLRGTGLV